MAVIQIEAQLSTEQLFKAVKQMPQNELEKLVAQVLALRAERVAPRLSENESALLLKINRGVPKALQKRYNALIAKRQTETLSKKEYNELLHMTSRIERLDVERMKYLVALARLRKKSLTTLMRELGIKTSAYV
ncbi:MAG: STAS/SEC14 domain-containing protein [candidate division KSB1 bacterium]|nr:STAS/SEC14 domain-containing protein [candidate division KSB1 bacterium]MDZ7364887.1 STAS/SEC14 domain-containing protein [candidate division KSB1 bacterium]MDZ7402990.1 STAS/SEC14 domain-containing protein [candidate division KSB1 bacterium]